MSIGGVTSTNNMSVMQMTSTNITDTKSKSIQKELTDVQQQLRQLSSDEELSASEKSNEQKQLQKKKTDLNAELKRHQEELDRSQKRESMLAELRESQNTQKEPNADGEILPEEEASDDKLQTIETAAGQIGEKNPASEGTQSEQVRQPGTIITQSSDGTVILKEAAVQTENTGTDPVKETSAESADSEEKAGAETETMPAGDRVAADAGFSDREIRAMVSADVSAQQADHVGTVVSKTNDGIAILKGEIKQDEQRGVDTERKQDELDRMERQRARAMAFQFSVLGGMNDIMKTAAKANADETESGADDAGKSTYTGALNVSQEEQAQRFYVSFG